MSDQSVKVTCAICKKDVPSGGYFALVKINGRIQAICESCAEKRELSNNE